MVDAAIARGRLRGLTALGRVRPGRGGGAAAPETDASARRTGTDGAAIAAGTPTRPSTPSPRPGTDALAASTI
jgi:hypothetical protein